MAIVYLSTGSNLGDREAALSQALTALNNQAGKVIRCSSIYETEPWGFNAELNFLNQVLILRTSLTPDMLNATIHDIEKEMGRSRNSPAYESRIIDIDILLYGRQIISREGLLIPHPRLHQRKFVLVPLAEISPGRIHPVLKRKISSLLESVDDECTVRVWKKAAEL